MATKGDQYDVITGNIWNYANRDDTTGVEEALSRGVDVNLRNKAGWSPAHAASAGGATRVLSLLASRNADFNLRDNAGRTPVHEAARNGELQALRFLRKQGCDFAAAAANGQTPLSVAKGDAVRCAAWLETLITYTPIALMHHLDQSDRQ